MADESHGTLNGTRGGDPRLHGKNIERRRETDQWNYRFKLGGVFYRGSLQTHDKAKAEQMAQSIKGQKLIDIGCDDVDARLSRLEDAVAAIRSAQLKQKIRHGIQTARDAAHAAIASGEPFILLLPGREGRYISNIDQRDIVALMMKEQIARLDGKEAIRAAPTNMLMESYDGT